MDYALVLLLAAETAAFVTYAKVYGENSMALRTRLRTSELHADRLENELARKNRYVEALEADLLDSISADGAAELLTRMFQADYAEGLNDLRVEQPTGTTYLDLSDLPIRDGLLDPE